MVALGDVAELNPRLADTIQPSTQVSFVPMAAVTEVTGEIVREEMRPYVEVAKGFTPFKSDDVIIAKITPCFQNGKIAHAKLSQPWGFGSTEFHVVRADEKRLFPPYIFHYLRQDYIYPIACSSALTGYLSPTSSISANSERTSSIAIFSRTCACSFCSSFSDLATMSMYLP